MARPNIKLINAIRNTAKKLENGAPYQWGHMGSCNCGHLAQEITNSSKEKIHDMALQRYGDWTEQANDYCPTSGYPLDHLISMMIDSGLDVIDLKHLEKLSDKRVLAQLTPNKRFLKYNVKADVILYLTTWADMLENKLLQRIKLTDIGGAKESDMKYKTQPACHHEI